MAKQQLTSLSGQRQRAPIRSSSRRAADSAVKVPVVPGAAWVDQAPRLPPRLVIARSQLEHLPEAERRLFAHGLAHVIQRQATASAGPVVVQRRPNRLQVRATAVQTELRSLIATATWPALRRVWYPMQSAAGIARARDRKAGRTADLTGLGAITSLDRFAKAMKQIQKDWPTRTPRQRIDAIGAAANVELTRAGVPTFLLVDPATMTAKASFSVGAWAMEVNQELLATRTVDDAAAGLLANAGLHESRHAEQHFLAARYSAGYNHTDAAGLVAEQGVPDAVAREAVKQKFSATTDTDVAQLGQRMFDQYAANRGASASAANAGSLDAARDDMGAKRAAAQAAYSALAKAVTPARVAAAARARDALKAAIIEVYRGYLAYRGVPSEADAHEVGDAAELAFQGWT